MTDGLGTLEQPGEFDALVKLRPDEPYFLLLGRDRLSPERVCDWADANRRRALAEYERGEINREKLEQELRQSTEAEMVAANMRAYKAGWAADQASGQRSLSYTGHEVPEDQARRDRLARARSRAVTAIHNAVSEVADLVALLDAEWSDDPAMADIANVARDTNEDMKLLADAARPKMPQQERAAA